MVKCIVKLEWQSIFLAIALLLELSTPPPADSNEPLLPQPRTEAQTGPQIEQRTESHREQQKHSQPKTHIRPPATCPTEVEPLLQALLRDLPEYVNRVRHRRGGTQSALYAIAASKANLEPLPVVTNYPNPEQGGLHQSFFTLLERQYDTRQATVYQQYHWLFLANTSQGWHLAILYSRSGPYPETNEVPSPLQDTTQEATGRAIRLWLRDCHAGAIKPFS